MLSCEPEIDKATFFSPYKTGQLAGEFIQTREIRGVQRMTVDPQYWQNLLVRYITDRHHERMG